MADLIISSDSVQLTDTTVCLVGTAGETVLAGQPVYVDAADAGTWKLASADVSATETANSIGISLCVSFDGQPLVIAVGGDINIGGTMVIGETYTVSDLGGKIAPLTDLAGPQDQKATILGIATTATNLKIDIFAGDTVKA